MADAILVGATPGGFRVRNRTTGEQYEAHLVRTGMMANFRSLNKCLQQRQVGLDLGFYVRKEVSDWGSESNETYATFKKNGREYKSEYRMDHHVVDALDGWKGKIPEVRSQVVEGEWELERGLDLENFVSWKAVLDPKKGWHGTFRYD